MLLSVSLRSSFFFDEFESRGTEVVKVFGMTKQLDIQWFDLKRKFLISEVDYWIMSSEPIGSKEGHNEMEDQQYRIEFYRYDHHIG